MRLSVFWLLWIWVAGCRLETPEWNVFADPPAAKIMKRPPKDSPLALPLPADGFNQPPAAEHVLVGESRRVLLLDASGRRILAADVPSAEGAEPMSWLPVLFLEKRRELVVLRHDSLWKLSPASGAGFQTWVKIPEAALCGVFQFPLEKQLQGPENFGIDPETGHICIVLEDASDTRRTARVDIDPDTGKSSLDCSSFGSVLLAGNPKNAPSSAAACQPGNSKDTEIVHPSWPVDETDCSIRIEGVRIGFHPDDEDAGSCRILSQGQDADQRHSIWCISDTETEYGARTCYIVDHLRRRKLELAVEILPDVQIRWSPRRESVMLGEYLFFLQLDPIRFLPVEGKTLLFL